MSTIGIINDGNKFLKLETGGNIEFSGKKVGSPDSLLGKNAVLTDYKSAIQNVNDRVTQYWKNGNLDNPTGVDNIV